MPWEHDVQAYEESRHSRRIDLDASDIIPADTFMGGVVEQKEIPLADSHCCSHTQELEAAPLVCPTPVDHSCSIQCCRNLARLHR